MIDITMMEYIVATIILIGILMVYDIGRDQ